MSMTDGERLGPTPECPDLEELLAAQAAGIAPGAHEAACPNCQAEIALFAAFEREPSAEERPAVEFAAKRLRAVDWVSAGEHGLPAKRESLWKRWLRPGVLAPASVVLACSLVLVTALQLNHRAGGAGEIRVPEAETLRSQEVEAVSPIGPVGSAPAELRWKEVPGAAAYRVQVMEVDKTVLWKADALAPFVQVPADVASRMVPGKRILWEVTALTASGAELARSGTQNFTVNLH